MFSNSPYINRKIYMDELYTKNDLSKNLKLSVSTIDNHMREGKINYLKIGKSVRFSKPNVKEYLRNYTQGINNER